MVRLRRRILQLAIIGVTASAGPFTCSPTANTTDCTQGKRGATYSIKVTNPNDDRTDNVVVVVTKYKKSLSHDGETITLGPGESKSTSVFIKKGEERYVGVFWPGPKGRNSYVWRRQLDGKC